MEQVKTRKIISWIILTGLLTGSIDAFLAIAMNYKLPAAVIFKFIASGVFGADAFNMGTGGVICGILFHYCIAFAWTIIFFLLYPKLLAIVKFRFILIVLTGLFIWVVMNLVIVPLSSIPPQSFHLVPVLKNMGALILAFGLPIILIANAWYARSRME